MALRDYYSFGRNMGQGRTDHDMSSQEKEKLMKVRQGIFNQLQGQDVENEGKNEKTGLTDISDFSGVADFTGMVNVYSKYIYQSEHDKTNRLEVYREMAKFPEIAFAIDEYTNEAINFDPTGLEFCDLAITNPSIAENEHARKTLLAEWRYLMYDIMDADEHVYSWFREYMIDGEVYFEKIFDENKQDKGITKVKKLMTARCFPLWEDIESDEINFFAYKTEREVLSLPSEAIAYANSGLYQYNHEEDDKVVLSILDQAVTTYKRLKLLEDSLVIYRLVRAPERRVFKIDVGSLPKGRAEQYMKELMRRYRQRKYFDPSTGDVSEGIDAMAMTEDFWFPVFQGGRSSDVTSLPGGQGLGEIEDVDYFLNKLYRGLKIPKSRFGEDGTFNIGNTDDITRDEVKFVKEVKRYCKRFSRIFKNIFITHLKLKDIWGELGLEEKDLNVVMTNNNLFDRYFEAKILDLKFENFSKFTDLIDAQEPVFSTEMIVKKYLEMTDEEWAKNVEKLTAEQAWKKKKEKEASDEEEGSGDIL